MGLHVRTDKERVAGWKEQLTIIMRIFNVRRPIFYWRCAS